MSPPKLLILRTSRFATTAVSCARDTWPGAEIRVLHQQGTGQELDAASVTPSERILMPPGGITLVGVLFSPWGRIAKRWRPDHVVVQWWNGHGGGHVAASSAALWLQPRGFHAILEDGRRIRVSPAGYVSRLLATAAVRVAGVGLVAVISAATALLWPIATFHRHRERRRMKTAA